MTSGEFIGLTLTPMAIAVLAAIVCALPGNFLLLRRQALLGDAISHVVLPGVVLAFLITGAMAAWPMMIGAAVAALIAVALIEAIVRFGAVEPGAAMGVVFTALFAAGVLLLEQSGASNVHFDVEHALYGNLESLIWLDAVFVDDLFAAEALLGLPPQLPRLVVVLIGFLAALAVCWRLLAITTFDPDYARAVGAPVGATAVCLAGAAAIAAVAAFDAVGAVIVIAMFICPPATARLVTDSLPRQVGLSAGFAASAAIFGFALADLGPRWVAGGGAVSAAGAIATAAGAQLLIAALIGPRRREVAPR
ncbi:MAG: metal ABC transporter permease [Pseudomonadota bacterium]